MLKKVIKYTDFDGNERNETFYFNLSKAELIEMELTTPGGVQQMLERIVEAQDAVKIFDFFKELIRKSYGEKSLDGKYFRKSAELSDAFLQTEAYSELFMELTSDADKAAAFLRGIVPPSFAAAPSLVAPET